MTYVTLSVLFEHQEINALKGKVVSLLSMAAIITTNYLIEIATRFRDNRSMLLVHHMVAILDGVFALSFLSTVNLKVALLLAYFITYESITFVRLVMYRLLPCSKWTPRVILAGIVFMGTSRLFQVVSITIVIVNVWDDILWHAIVQYIVTLLVTAIQIWSLTIHYGMLQRCKDKQQESGAGDIEDDTHRSVNGSIEEQEDTSSEDIEGLFDSIENEKDDQSVFYSVIEFAIP